MTAGPRYETAKQLAERLGHTDTVVCADCGVFVMDKTAHTRFHSILSAQAWAIAVLQNAHISPVLHDTYEAYGKIKSKKFDNWPADALAEAVPGLDAGGGADDPR